MKTKMNKDQYENPLVQRYASKEMIWLFSSEYKILTWRKLWIFLAESQKELGLEIILEEWIEDLKNHQKDIDWNLAQKYEKILKHDVMSHIHAYGDQLGEAKKILHLGATSAYVTDNTDLIIMKEGLALIQQKLINVIDRLSQFAWTYKDVATLGFTHFQPAQLTTVGKRACLWLQSFVDDFQQLEYHLDHLEFLGVKGTTGTQASFKSLFHNDFDKVQKLDQMVAQKAGFHEIQKVAGQTYDRKTDSHILNLCSQIAQSAHKMTNDIRLLQHLKEMQEPFEVQQVGSSAMAYKQNPIKSERVASLAKFVISLAFNGAFVSSTQWLERTLDDSANRRLSIPQAFLAVDAILKLSQNIIEGLSIFPQVIQNHVQQELPFIATENILMRSVQKGQDRQVIHEIIRELSMIESSLIKQGQSKNKLLEKIAKDSRIHLNQEELQTLIHIEDFVGFAPQQVDHFLNHTVFPLLKRNHHLCSVEKSTIPF